MYMVALQMRKAELYASVKYKYKEWATPTQNTQKGGFGMQDKSEKDLQIESLQQENKMLRERRSPFAEWAQLNLDSRVIQATHALIRKSPVAYDVYLFILDKMDQRNALVCSMSVFCEALGFSRQTISKAIKVLKERQFIDVRKSGTTNVYLLNSELAWKSWGNGYRYAEFNANVLLSESDQIVKTKHVETTRRTIATLGATRNGLPDDRDIELLQHYANGGVDDEDDDTD